MDIGEPMGMVPTQEEKTFAMLSWGLAIIAGFISPLIFYFVAKDKPFTYYHAAQGLAFHLVALVANIVIGAVTCGVGWIVVTVLAIIVSVMGIMKANNGELFVPPLTGGLAKSMFKV